MKIIKFYAEWCVPCQKYAPVLEAYCNRRGIALQSVDIEKDKDMSIKYGITSLPTTIFILEGKPDVIRMGAMNEDMLDDVLELLGHNGSNNHR